MSFLDDQATGQIGIGEKANLSTLTRRKRKRKKGQAPTGSETYSLMPQNEFSNIVSSPTDIQQVGIGNLLQAQGSSAGEVPNVFEQYDSAAPVLGTKEAVYYQPPDEEEEEEEEEDLPSVEDDPMRDFSPDTGIDDPFSANYQGKGGRYDPADNELTPGSTAAKIFKAVTDPFRVFTEEANKALGRVEPVVANPKVPITYDPGGKGRDAAAAQAAAMEESISNVVGYTPSVGGGDDAGGGETGVDGGGADAPTASNVGSLASGGTVKAKNKNSFMSMKGK